MSKRLYSEINSKKELKVKPVKFLMCEICGKRCYDYKLCNQPYTYCSEECLEVLLLSQKNDYLDAKDNNDSFMKRTVSNEDLMSMDAESGKSYNSWDSINNPEEYAMMFHDAVEMIKDK